MKESKQVRSNFRMKFKIFYFIIYRIKEIQCIFKRVFIPGIGITQRKYKKMY